VQGVGPEGSDPLAVIQTAYDRNETDEFITPTVIVRNGKPVAPMRDGDALICFNYRADRVRQITRVLARNCDVAGGLTVNDARDLPKAAELDLEIPRVQAPKNIHYVCMTQYDKNFKLPAVIPPESMDNLLANVLADAGMRNLRVAETEKYAHVTYFFNGGIEKPFPGEDRVLIPSQKVATYDLAPEMSAAGIADAVVKAVNDTAFDVIIVNFANADMVGHSGRIEPTVRAVETIDTELCRVYQAVRHRGGALLVTADHGNAELLIDPVTGGPHTAHTTNPVPFILISDEKDTSHHAILRPGGSLRDISPTILKLLKLQKPEEMTGLDLQTP